MLDPINIPKMTSEYRHDSMAPLLARIAELDGEIDGMENSTEKGKLTKRRAGLWSMALELAADIREMEEIQNDNPKRNQIVNRQDHGFGAGERRHQDDCQDNPFPV